MQKLSRRDIIKASAAVLVSFSISRSANAQDTAKSLDPDQVDSFLALHRDGSVTLYVSRVDVGTG